MENHMKQTQDEVFILFEKAFWLAFRGILYVLISVFEF